MSSPDLSNKNILITGATGGLGFEVAKSLASKGATLYVLARNPKKFDILSQELQQQFDNTPILIEADVSSLSQVKSAAQTFLDLDVPLHMLINNAGGIHGKVEMTKDGLESTMMLNYFSLVFFTELLKEKLIATARESEDPVRVINTASMAYSFSPMGLKIKSVFEMPTVKLTAAQYSQSKLAVIYYTQSLAEELADENISINCLHPGVVGTGFGQGNIIMGPFIKFMKPLLLTPEQGAKTTLHIAYSEQGAKMSGEYFSSSKVAYLFPFARDKKIRDTLYEKTIQRLNLAS